MQKNTHKESTKEKVEQAEKKLPQRVRCNGGAQSSGHPVVYLSLNEEGFVLCPYCSRRFGKNS